MHYQITLKASNSIKTGCDRVTAKNVSSSNFGGATTNRCGCVYFYKFKTISKLKLAFTLEQQIRIHKVSFL